MKEAVRLFNDQKYWECHEALEDLWAEDTQDSARLIYWAVIQVAASCIHVRDHNLIGAQGMLAKARDKFRRAREQGVLTDQLRFLDWEELERLVLAVPEASTLADFKFLFDFRFKNYPDF